MQRVLITGMSGTGKSSVIAELAARGYRAVDVDTEEYSEIVDVPEDELTGPGPGKDWVWREDRIAALLSADDAPVLFIAGCAPNQGRFRSRFDYVVLLSASPQVSAYRLTGRTNNGFGKDPGELARSLELQRTIEPLLRRSADLEIDTSAPLDEVVDRILALVQPVDR